MAGLEFRTKKIYPIKSRGSEVFYSEIGDRVYGKSSAFMAGFQIKLDISLFRGKMWEKVKENLIEVVRTSDYYLCINEIEKLRAEARERSV